MLDFFQSAFAVGVTLIYIIMAYTPNVVAYLAGIRRHFTIVGIQMMMHKKYVRPNRVATMVHLFIAGWCFQGVVRDIWTTDVKFGTILEIVCFMCAIKMYVNLRICDVLSQNRVS
jgi:uncharacterized membrane protein